MTSSLFLNLTFKCLHHFAWPFLALLYPMCASVQAIETDSYEQTKHLISYWILLSLIYLFEYALISLIPWFQPWLYIKLMIIFWLTIPDFGRASYVYNNLIRSMKPKIDTWRKCFVEEDNFLMHVERYMKENGTEALEKLIASKNTMLRPDAEVITNEFIATGNNEMLKHLVQTNGERLTTEHKVIKDFETIEQKEIPATTLNTMHRPDAEVTNEIIDNDNKEMLKTNGDRLQSENKDIKDLVAIEKKEIPATKQRTYADIVASQTTSSTIVETKEIAGRDTAGGEHPQSSSTLKEVQREWTCALCLVTSSSEKDLNSHLNGRRHRKACEAAGLKVAKKLPATQKNVLPEPFRMINSKLICKVCNVMLPSEEYMASHIKGWKHLSNMKS
ncbi:uncharacterized protein LOC123912784 isoform X2 [Trifolium pratense]|uniref:uncharacterized protein LOC123912784 isoform X2 n=1 Tax=Trifolium pratense TaxID=57577 RepID=UPI001E69636D|nr:uncharacterized protein LOC123912784 isoform X2 [Trifolium pratense]